MASAIYKSFKKGIINGTFDLDTNTFKVALCTSTYAPQAATHVTMNDISNQLSTANGYTSGGATLTGLSATLNTTGSKWDANDVEWTSSTLTARYGIIYKYVSSTAASNPLVAYIDFGEDKSSSSGTFKIQWHTDGILTLA